MSIELHEIGHRFGQGPWLFRGLTWSFHPGRVYAVTGPSGSGKSTLLSILASLERPEEGMITRDQISRVSWVFQNPFGVPGRNAVDHVALPIFGRGAHINEAESTARNLLLQVGLSGVADRPFKDLSGGEAQRLMLARGLASRPDLLLVDEPTAQLDRHTASQVDSVLASLTGSGMTVVVATHDSNTRDACTDHVDLATFGEARPR